MTPELTKALELTGREHFLQLASELARIKQEITNKHAAQGSLHSGAYLGSLLSLQVDALARCADAVVEDYARLAIKASATTVDDVAELKSGLTGLLSGKGLLDALRELVSRLRVPEGTIMEHAERSLEALRGRALLRLERLLAEDGVMFKALVGDRVTIRKSNGQTFRDVPAAVQPNLILVERTEIPIEPGDTVDRRTHAGVDESFVVDDPGFQAALSAMPAHYRLRVHRADAPPASAGTTIYQVHGPDARFNINSVDSSTNVVTQAPAEMFTTLRYAIASGIRSDSEREALVTRLEAMETESGKPGFATAYANFMAVAANHMEILGPFVPALTQLLTGK